MTDLRAEKPTVPMASDSSPIGGNSRAAKPIEPLKNRILDTLAAIGVSGKDKYIAVSARVIEVVVIRPDMSLEEIIDNFASTHYMTASAVTRIIEKCFDVYDTELYDSLTAVTHTSPQTAKDALFDIAVYLRASYGESQYA